MTTGTEGISAAMEGIFAAIGRPTGVRRREAMSSNDIRAALTVLRDQIAALLSLVDTAALPPPDRVRHARDELPGYQWEPDKNWTVFTLDEPGSEGIVYVDHGCESATGQSPWGDPGDWEALSIEKTRRVALALLAAADTAEQRLIQFNVVPLGHRRTA